MSFLKFKPFDKSYWDDKLLILSPSDTPKGYSFLFTQSFDDMSLPMSYKNDTRLIVKTWSQEFDVYMKVGE